MPLQRCQEDSPIFAARLASRCREILIRAALYRDDYGKLTRTATLDAMPPLALATLRVEAAWARARNRYGGWRLTRHRRAENVLVGRLRYAIDRDLDPLDLSWDLTELEGKLKLHWSERAVEPAVDHA